MFPADLQYWECQTGGLFRRTGRYNESLVILDRTPLVWDGLSQTLHGKNSMNKILIVGAELSQASRNAD